jgi:hypothetical protein
LLEQQIIEKLHNLTLRQHLVERREVMTNCYIPFRNNQSYTTYRALSDLFYLADLSGNAAWRRLLVGRERGEEGEWEEWEGGGRLYVL